MLKPAAPSNLWTRLQSLGPLLALLLLCTVVACLSPDFRKPENALNILNQNAYVGLVAIGMTAVIILGGIDLSVGSQVALLGGMGVWTMNAVFRNQLLATFPPDKQAEMAKELATISLRVPAEIKATISPYPSILAGAGVILAGGPILGLLNGLLIAFGRLAPFIATLGTMAIFRSIIKTVASGGNITSEVASYNSIGDSLSGLHLPFTSSAGRDLFLPWSTLTFLAVAVVAEVLLRYTVLGRGVFAIGDNAVAAKYAGVRVKRTTVLVYGFCGVVCGLSALMNSSRMNSVASAQDGSLYELDAIAAVVIGGTSMRGGRGSVLGTVVGVLLLGVISNALTMLSVPSLLQDLFKGVIIIAAVLLQRQRTA